MTEKQRIPETERREPRSGDFVVARVVKADGRLLRYYSWRDGGANDDRRRESRQRCELRSLGGE